MTRLKCWFVNVVCWRRPFFISSSAHFFVALAWISIDANVSRVEKKKYDFVTVYTYRDTQKMPSTVEPPTDFVAPPSQIVHKRGITAPPKKAASLSDVKKAVSNDTYGDELSESAVSHGQASVASSASTIFRQIPQLLNDVKVPYPERARQMMVEGVVRMRLTVSDAGRVVNAEILSGPSFGLRKAALEVSRKLNFLPATNEQGQAKTAQIDHEVIFKLTNLDF